MRFAKRVFLIAGIYGMIVTVPLFFSEETISRDFPPAITHPELFYGFACVTLAWQVAFLVISTDPARYRLMMIPAMLEKFSYGVAIVWLFAAARVPEINLVFGLVDFLLGMLFVVAFVRVRQPMVSTVPHRDDITVLHKILLPLKPP
jgi:hypothetical protein